MGCLFAIFAGFFPRLALFFLWVFTPLVTRAFNSFIWPLLGIIFLPFTTLMYVFVYTPGFGVSGWGWFWVFLGLLIDISTFAGSALSRRESVPGYGGAYGGQY